MYEERDIERPVCVGVDVEEWGFSLRGQNVDHDVNNRVYKVDV
jgi:hypothetical protein